jgi:AcrR family transcriptional regulator
VPRIVSSYREEARKKVLEAALDVFKEKGYFGSTMEDIAGKLGISKGAIYQYFDSKEELLASLYTSAPQNLRSQFVASSAKDSAEVAKEVFDRMGTRKNSNLFADFLAEASRNEKLQKAMKENIDRFVEVVEELLKAKRPKMSKAEAEKAHHAAVMLSLIFNGLSCWLVVGVPEPEVRRVWADSVDLLIE